jgi:hypothetical protein
MKHPESYICIWVAGVFFGASIERSIPGGPIPSWVGMLLSFLTVAVVVWAMRRQGEK